MESSIQQESPRERGTKAPFDQKAERQIQRLNRTYAMLTDVNQLIVRKYQQEEILARACHVAVVQGGFHLAWIGLIDPTLGALQLVAHCGVSGDTLAVLHRSLTDPALACAFTARTLQTGVATVCNDVAGDPLAAAWRDLALERNYRSLVSLPLIGAGKPIGTFNLYAGEPDFFDSEEVRLLNELTTEISFAREMAQREDERLAAEVRNSRQRDTLISHTSRRGSDEDDLTAALRSITESSAKTLGCARVSIWRYSANRTVLECHDLFELAVGRHAAGTTLAAKDFPAYFRVLADGEVMAINDVLADPRTSELIESYFRTLDIGALMDVPIYLGGAVAGVLCHEHQSGARVWTADERTFAVAMANLVSLSMEGWERRRAESEVRRLNLELEQRVRERTAQLEAINQELESFSYSVSHDLRTPLRHINGFIGLLAKSAGDELNPMAQKHLATIGRAAIQMNQLIDDLLEFSRMGRAELRQTTVQPASLLAEIIRDLEPEIGGRKIVWRLERLPPVQADPAMVRQVFINLLTNAVKYSRQREVAEIGVTAELRDAEIVFAVRDNGAGFDMAQADRLFGVFQRLHSPREFEGTGIGLANVRRIIQRHGGRTWAEGKVDEGATFYFSLPTTRCTAEADKLQIEATEAI